MFSKGFGNYGLPSMKTYMTLYKVGDFVDIKVNGAIHKGMPYRYYHGRTGRVWNITKSAVGVMVNKQVKGKILHKRLHVRIEHIKPSRCQEEFKNRVADHEKTKAEAKKKGNFYTLSIFFDSQFVEILFELKKRKQALCLLLYTSTLSY